MTYEDIQNWTRSFGVILIFDISMMTITSNMASDLRKSPFGDILTKVRFIHGTYTPNTSDVKVEVILTTLYSVLSH